MVTPFNGYVEPRDFAKLFFGNYFLETQLGCYLAYPSPISPDTHLDLLPCPNVDIELYTISSSSVSSTNVVRNPRTYDMWTMYFDGSKTQECSRDGCVLIDPLQRKQLISSGLEFKCTNNTAEYEELILGIQKAIDLNVVVLKVVGDSEIVVC